MNKCMVEIEFAVDAEIQRFECDLEKGHIGPHRKMGINDYNGGDEESYTIFWESKIDREVKYAVAASQFIREVEAVMR